MKNNDMRMHLRGKSIFIDDIPTSSDILHAVLFCSPVARGIIKKLDTSIALAAPDIEGIFTHQDIPGKNQIGHVAQDQPFLAFDNVEYIGQPIAIVVGKNRRAAERACKLIRLEVEEQEAVFHPLEAFKKGMIHGKRRFNTMGDTTQAFEKCAHIAQGTVECGPQEHFYFETQRALAIPKEDGTIKVCASSQSPGAYHQHIAEILGISMHRVELEIRRLGGAFGGKESSAVWVCSPALAAWHLKKPVKLYLTRNEDIATTGKRHPYIIDYKIGMDNEGQILALEVDLYQHGGACADISLAVLGRSFLHVTGSYFIPNIKVSAVSCKTNIPPNNAFRGFGVPQGIFAIESAIAHLAEVANVHQNHIKYKNLLRPGSTFPYGMTLEKCNAKRCWQMLDETVNISKLDKEIKEYNKNHAFTKKGMAIVPVCFGISFAQTALNQASALVNVYTDGSVSISTGAVEMGQGVNAKILSVAAKTLGIDKKLVRMETTNTTRIPNASPTSASTGADLNGMATRKACLEILGRLQEFAARRINHPNIQDMTIKDGRIHIGTADTGYNWFQLIKDAHWARIDLSSHAFYATPGIYLNPDTEKGRPFAYYSYGTSMIQVKVDLRRGTSDIESIVAVHDVGQSLSEQIDKGQIQGAIIQAIGWATTEQLRYGENGQMLTKASSYKIPDINSCPKDFRVILLPNSDNPYAICNSKAVGEPPFIHGLGAYFAILSVLREIRQDKPIPSLPLTPEKVFSYIHR